MAKIQRKTQSIFGSTAAIAQISQFGSLASGAPAYSIDPAVIQSLSNYLGGWFSAVIGSNSPAIEDMNAICYLYAYQLAYLMQAGIAEYDAGTTYYKGSIAQDGSGVSYTSLTDINLGNALSNATYWRPTIASQTLQTLNPTTQSPYVLGPLDSGKVFLVNSTLGAQTFNLPSPKANYLFRIKDSGFNAATNPITVHRFSSENFENVATDYVFSASGGEIEIASDGTSWFIIGR